MTDYIVTYKLNNTTGDKVLTIEDDIVIEVDKNNKDQDIKFEREELVRDILLEKLKGEYGNGVKLISFEPVVDKDYDIDKLTY